MPVVSSHDSIPLNSRKQTLTKSLFSSQTFRVRGHVRRDLKRCNPLDGAVGEKHIEKTVHTHTHIP